MRMPGSRRGTRRLAALPALLIALACGTGGAGPSPGAVRTGDLEPMPFDAAGCEATSSLPVAESTDIELVHEGQSRKYRVYVPSGLEPGSPVPLVLLWHGLGGSGATIEGHLGRNRVPEGRGYVAVYPFGIGGSFNGGGCCSKFGDPKHEADDVGFGRAIVDDLARRVCIDRRRIYSAGLSNGGFMSEFNACEAADLYAAVAAVSARSPTSSAPPRARRVGRSASTRGSLR